MLATLLCTLAFLLPACDPPDDPDTSTRGPSDLADAPDEPEDDPQDDPQDEPDPQPHHRDRLSDAPRAHDVPPSDAHRPEDLVDVPHGDDTSPEPPDDLADA